MKDKKKIIPPKYSKILQQIYTEKSRLLLNNQNQRNQLSHNQIFLHNVLNNLKHQINLLLIATITRYS